MAELRLMTIVTEAVLEHRLAKHIEAHGAHGFTVINARGKGDRGTRDAEWDYNANIKIDIICTEEVCEELSEFLQKKYYEDYAMISYSCPVTVLRDDKF